MFHELEENARNQRINNLMFNQIKQMSQGSYLLSGAVCPQWWARCSRIKLKGARGPLVFLGVKLGVPIWWVGIQLPSWSVPLWWVGFSC